MRCLAIILLVLAFAAIDAKHVALERRAVSCDTVLSTKLCDTLKVVAEKFKLRAADIDRAVSKAVAEGKVTAEDIYKEAVDFLINEVADKKCEAFLAAKMCARIQKIADEFSIGYMVEALIKEAIAMGVPSEEKIFLAVMNLIRREVAGKGCDDFLAPKMCNKLVEIGGFLKINAVKVAALVKEAIIAGYTRKDDIYKAVIKFFKDDVASLTCEDILNSKICIALEKIGGLTKLTRADIDEAVKDAILRGKTLVTEVVDDVKEYFKKVASSKKCEDILPASACSALKTLASTLKVKAEMVDEAVREAIKDGVMEIKKIVEYCEQYVRDHVTCEAWLGDKTCKSIRKYASLVGVKAQQVEAKIRELVAQGKTTISDLYKEIVAYIKRNIWG